MITTFETQTEPVQMLTETCCDCRQPFKYQPFFIVPDREAFKPERCPECHRMHVILKQGEVEAKREAYERARREYQWNNKNMCPLIYRETDLTRLPVSQETAKKVLDWQSGPRGLLLHGKTGLGKSRCAWLLLRRLFVEEWKCAITFDDPSAFSRECIDQAMSSEDGGKAWFNSLAKANVVFFDDFGKSRFTDRVEADLFSLFEYRTSRGLPTILTTNFSGVALQKRMSADRGEPFVRRIREFCESVEFKA